MTQALARTLILTILIPLLLLIATPLAFAEDKPVLPTIDKQVMDSSGWADSTISKQDIAEWRITVTMPGDIKELEAYPVVIHDTPHEGMTADLTTVAVVLLHESGEKEPIEFRATKNEKGFDIALDIKSATKDVTAKDRLYITYGSDLPHEYESLDGWQRNLASMDYTKNDGTEGSTVVVEALAKPIDPAIEPEPTTSSGVVPKDPTPLPEATKESTYSPAVSNSLAASLLSKTSDIGQWILLLLAGAGITSAVIAATSRNAHKGGIVPQRPKSRKKG